MLDNEVIKSKERLPYVVYTLRKWGYFEQGKQTLNCSHAHEWATSIRTFIRDQYYLCILTAPGSARTNTTTQS